MPETKKFQILNVLDHRNFPNNYFFFDKLEMKIFFCEKKCTYGPFWSTVLFLMNGSKTTILSGTDIPNAENGWCKVVELVNEYKYLGHKLRLGYENQKREIGPIG